MRKSVIILWTFFLLLSVCAVSGDDTVYLTKDKYPTAFTREDLVAFHQSILNDNAAVFLKLKQEGRAWLSRAGVEVHIIDIDGSGKIKIQPINSTKQMWTLQEAVRQKN
jgi:hypothetical protein